MYMKLIKFISPRMLSLQARRPTGLLGRYIMTRIFLQGNADLNHFVKEMLDLNKTDSVLEVGFGPGKLVYDIARELSDGRVDGVDFSSAMLKQASKINRQFIADGRVALHKTDCSQLSFADNQFDKLCSSNTIYFWEQPRHVLTEFHRVLKPGGTIVIGFRDDKQMQNLDLSKDIFTNYSQEQVIELLSGADFANVSIKQKEGQPFTSYCALATKY